MVEAAEGAGEGARLDKWLWHARFFKSRSIAAQQVRDGAVRVNGERTAKPAHGLRLGDVLTFAQGRQARVVRVAAFGVRRGPAVEARALYDDLAPPEQNPPTAPAGPRPTKRDRRRMDAAPWTPPGAT